MLLNNTLHTVLDRKKSYIKDEILIHENTSSPNYLSSIQAH